MKTKIEFIQREDADGIWYFTEKNGGYVSSSGSFNIDKAYEFFKRYIRLANEKPVVTVLETIEIEAQ